MFRCCKRNSKSTKKNKLGIVCSLAITTIIAQVRVVALAADTTAPEVTRAFKKVDGGQAKLIITARDTESGLSKIVDESNNVLYTYNDGDPETVRFNITDTSLLKVYVVDKEGNRKEASLEIDTKEPTGIRGFIEEA